MRCRLTLLMRQVNMIRLSVNGQAGWFHSMRTDVLLSLLLAWEFKRETDYMPSNKSTISLDTVKTWRRTMDKIDLFLVD